MPRFLAVWLCCVAVPVATGRAADPAPRFERDIAPLLKTHCVKCHGPAKQEGKLNLSNPAGIARGGKSGATVAPHDASASRLWERVDSDEMPPDEPLSAELKDLLKRWITAGAPGLPTIKAGGTAEGEHWAFQPLTSPVVPNVAKGAIEASAVDRFVQSGLEAAGLAMNPQAERRTLIRRVSLDLTGLLPTPEELDGFLADQSNDAYARMVDRYLASPHYGERWGKYWLDAAGYADSNGYFGADTDRPLAYRYRDYVVRCFNEDRPFDRFVREQLAGDALSGFKPGAQATPEIVELLVATHFLRNGQDGSGESDGNPDEVRADRFYALESAMQNTSSALLGLTVQCAKCHAHKFEPISHEDYYRFQAIFFPVFNIDNWVKPNDRIVYAPLPGEHEVWEQQTRELDARLTQMRTEFKEWARVHQPRGEVVFEDRFETAGSPLAERWSPTAPGDDVPAGAIPVKLDVDVAPAAFVAEGTLQIIEGNTQGDSWLSTRQPFDWTPADEGESIQVTFDLVRDKLKSEGASAMRIGYLIATHDFNDNSQTPGGNLLIDGNPSGSTTIYIDYPGADSRGIGEIGTTAYSPGHNYGIRITNIGSGKAKNENKDKPDKFRLEHLVDGVPEEKTIELKAADLPDGGFSFEYCCGRSFVVANVRVERFPAAPSADTELAKFREELKKRQEELNKTTAEQKSLAGRRPGKIAWASDMAATLPDVHLLERGNYTTPGPNVEPGTFSILKEVPTAANDPGAGELSATTSGPARRLAWANWVTQPGTRAASLMARVQVNRIWQQHFGTGIVATPDNLGLSGAPPSHPELLDWLAAEFVRSGWSIKAIHRLILNSAAYRQSSALSKPGYEADPEDRLLWRFPVRRMDAEAIRDATLAVTGDLDPSPGGPYVPTSRNDAGEIVVTGDATGPQRRSLYLYQKRTQVLSFLAVFDAPSIVFNSVRRPRSTMPLQSLSLLNSEFAVTRAKRLAERLKQQEADEESRTDLAYRLLFSRAPTANEAATTAEFIATQSKTYAEAPDARDRAWNDLCQALLSSNEFLYVE